jgi:hypothetical protein
LISIPKENNKARDEEAEAAVSDTGKDIKKGIDAYEARIKSTAAEGEIPPAGDSTRSEE